MSDTDALNDVYKEIADLIGYDNAMILYTYFKGQQITFPVKLFKPERIQDIIKKRYDGTNAKELARTYGYSERWIKELIRKG
ncbi:MAG: Mor transcription activator family protein [Clostridiales bacterium]|nr:Mor transcription activator family protein [Clostridiales bacterium]